MLTSTPDSTRQLVSDRAARLAAEARPRRSPAPPRRSQSPPWRWLAAARLHTSRTSA